MQDLPNFPNISASEIATDLQRIQMSNSIPQLVILRPSTQEMSVEKTNSDQTPLSGTRVQHYLRLQDNSHSQ